VATSPIAAILWDLDGVIVDSAPFHYEAYRRVLAARGVLLSEERFRKELLGLRNEAILQALLGATGPAEARRLAAQKEAIFRRLLRGRVRALPGALPLLRRARQAGLRQAIVSSTPRRNIATILKELGAGELLDAVVGEEDAARGKPDPEGFLIAAARLGVPPQGCVVIEDAPQGIAAGKAAGMRVIAVSTTRPPELLAQADLVVPSLDDPRIWPFLTQPS
jgi:beta-phosphoglucomutase family hydrolase